MIFNTFVDFGTPQIIQCTHGRSGCKAIKSSQEIANIYRFTSYPLSLSLPLPLPCSSTLLSYLVPLCTFFDHAHNCCTKQYRQGHFKRIEVRREERQNGRQWKVNESQLGSQRSTLVNGSQCGANQTLRSKMVHTVRGDNSTMVVDESQLKSTELNISQRNKLVASESAEVNVSQRKST